MIGTHESVKDTSLWNEKEKGALDRERPVGLT